MSLSDVIRAAESLRGLLPAGLSIDLGYYLALFGLTVLIGAVLVAAVYIFARVALGAINSPPSALIKLLIVTAAVAIFVGALLP